MRLEIFDNNLPHLLVFGTKPKEEIKEPNFHERNNYLGKKSQAQNNQEEQGIEQV
jgi:hypothetical protein